MRTSSVHRTLIIIAWVLLVVWLLLANRVFGYEVSGSFLINAPFNPPAESNQILPEQIFVAAQGHTEGTANNYASGGYYASLSTGFLGVYGSAYGPEANSYSDRAGSARAEASYVDTLHCLVPAGDYPEGLSATLYGVVYGRLSALGCDGTSIPICSSAFQTTYFVFGTSPYAVLDQRWDVSTMTSPLLIDTSFELTSMFVPPGTVLVESATKDLIVDGTLAVRGVAHWLYPYGDLVSAFDSAFYNHSGITHIELPDGVVCTSESGVFLTEAGQDIDADGLSASMDNCIEVFNPDQRDTNSDGYGNVCDPDLDNNGIVNFSDIAIFAQAFNTSNNDDADFNGDGFVNFLDYSIIPAFFLKPPGPSGLVPQQRDYE